MSTDIRSGRALLDDCRKIDPDVADLALSAALAVRIEPGLLRAARLDLIPNLDAGVESDLWFSDLVSSRSARSIVLDKFVLMALRDDLKRREVPGILAAALKDQNDEWLKRARQVVLAYHAHESPAILLEEEVIWHVVLNVAGAASAIDEAFQQAVKAMAKDPDRAMTVARWADRALVTLPAEALKSEAARLLAVGTSARLGDRSESGRRPGLEFVRGADWLKPGGGEGDIARIGLQLVDGALRFTSPDLLGSTPISMPGKDSRLIRVRWKDAGKAHEISSAAVVGNRVVLSSGTTKVEIETEYGAMFRLVADEYEGISMRFAEEAEEQFRDLSFELQSAVRDALLEVARDPGVAMPLESSAGRRFEYGSPRVFVEFVFLSEEGRAPAWQQQPEPSDRVATRVLEVVRVGKVTKPPPEDVPPTHAMVIVDWADLSPEEWATRWPDYYVSRQARLTTQLGSGGTLWVVSRLSKQQPRYGLAYKLTDTVVGDPSPDIAEQFGKHMVRSRDPEGTSWFQWNDATAVLLNLQFTTGKPLTDPSRIGMRLQSIPLLTERDIERMEEYEQSLGTGTVEDQPEDASAAILDMRLDKELQELFGTGFQKLGMSLVEDEGVAEDDPSAKWKYTIARSSEYEIVLLQIPRQMSDESIYIRTIETMAATSQGKPLRVLSRGYTAWPALIKLMERWQDTTQIDVAYVSWNRVEDLKTGQLALHEVLRFDPPNLAIGKNVYIAYSNKDDAWLRRLETHLKAIHRDGVIDVWSDQQIGPGTDWQLEITEAIAAARVCVMLITADFLSSKFIQEVEVPKLLERKAEEGLQIIPVIVKHCAWKRVDWLARMYVRPRDGQPLSTGDDNQIDVWLTEIAEEIVDIINSDSELGKQSSLTGSPPQVEPGSPRYAQALAEILDSVAMDFHTNFRLLELPTSDRDLREVLDSTGRFSGEQSGSFWERSESSYTWYVKEAVYPEWKAVAQAVKERSGEVGPIGDFKEFGRMCLSLAGLSNDAVQRNQISFSCPRRYGIRLREYLGDEFDAMDLDVVVTDSSTLIKGSGKSFLAFVERWGKDWLDLIDHHRDPASYWQPHAPGKDRDLAGAFAEIVGAVVDAILWKTRAPNTPFSHQRQVENALSGQIDPWWRQARQEFIDVGFSEFHPDQDLTQFLSAYSELLGYVFDNALRATPVERFTIQVRAEDAVSAVTSRFHGLSVDFTPSSHMGQADLWEIHMSIDEAREVFAWADRELTQTLRGLFENAS